MRLVDSHCHLDVDAFAGDLDETVARARAAGLCRMLTICTRLDGFARVAAVAERFEDVWCSVGVHPHEAGREGGLTAARLAEMAAHPKAAGIGESGLDYHYDNAPRPAQKESFRVHIEAARATGLPLIVHSRDADDDMADMLEEGGRDGRLRGVMHCFSSGPDLARRALDIGFYVSLAGILTFKSAGALREIARAVPPDRLLVETDAPFLAPVPKRGKRNEPAYTRHTLAALAAVKGVSEAEMAARTTENFFALFSRVSRPAEAAAPADPAGAAPR